MPENPTVAAILAELARSGLPIQESLLARVQGIVPRHSIAKLEGDSDTNELVSAWLSTRDAREPDEIAWIVLLELFRQQFDRTLPGLRESLEAHKMGITRTRVEVRRQLGSRYFHLGRRIDFEQPRSAVGAHLLNEALTVLLWVFTKQPRLSGQEQRKYNSQIATASVIVARSTTHAAHCMTLLDQAERHSLIAEGFGDRTEEHFAYRAEISLRRYAIARDPAPLAETLGILDEQSATTRRLLAARADLRLELAWVAVRSGPTAEGVALLRRAEDEYGDALLVEEGSGVATAYLRAKRGLVRESLYRYDTDRDGRRDRNHLDAAIEDWHDPETTAHIQVDAVVGALLDRARINMRANNVEAADRDRTRARRLAQAPTSRTEAKLVADELEQVIDDVIARDDIRGLINGIESILALPAEAPIPAAALMRGVRVVLETDTNNETSSVALRAVHRLETEIDHPALTAAGRRHVAGHAALLSWLLARRSGDTDGLSRTVDLYRRSFEAVAQHASVDALSNAGTCALSLARHLLTGNETDAEQAVSLLIEATEWLNGALDLASRKPALIRGDFDAVIAHSRCGEAAIRAYPITREPELLDTAITHLHAARDAGQHAVELTGLLADAYYRRGTRDRNPDDLNRALELKDEAFAGGNTTRENRSVTAAIAMRLRDITGDQAQLTTAALRALQAADCDPHWPWAVLQLALIAADHRQLSVAEIADHPPADLSALIIRGERGALRTRAAELAVSTTEFSAAILGGQVRGGERGVRVINDPHRLIEGALVLKRLGRDGARRERNDTDAFARWLKTHGCPPHWRLPEPLAVIDIDTEDAVYVMSREQGRVLGASVVAPQSTDTQLPLQRFEEALHFLAAYQAWRWASDPKPSGAGPNEQNAFNKQLDKAHKKIHGAPTLRADFAKALNWLAEAGAPVVAKKDPHPGNWIWSLDGHLVLIDVESTTNLPLLQEAVTVIDDLPLLDAADSAAWTTRVTLATEYCTVLREFGVDTPPMTDAEVLDRYEALALLHAIKGLGRVGRADIGVSSFSIATAHLQRAHYQALLSHLSGEARSKDVRDLATKTLTQHAEYSPSTADTSRSTQDGVPDDPAPTNFSAVADRPARRRRRASRPGGPPQ